MSDRRRGMFIGGVCAYSVSCKDLALARPDQHVAKRWVAGEAGALPSLGSATVEAIVGLDSQDR